MLPGLDEFMLRLGHLKVLLHAANEVGGNWTKITKEAGNLLTYPVNIEKSSNEYLITYLLKKNLCPVIKGGQDQNDSKKYKYPNIRILVNKDKKPSISFKEDDDSSRLIWWQDYCLAQQDISSRTGPISTIARKGSSRTTFSHICDWAKLLDLTSAGGDISIEGRFIISISGPGENSHKCWNPYNLGFEKLVFATLYFKKDLDLFSSLGRKLLECDGKIGMKKCRQLFVSALLEIVDEAKNSRSITSPQKFSIYQQYKDLERAAKKSKKDVGETSTAWHRVSSRVESYVDFGFLTKQRGDVDARHEYSYFTTDSLDKAISAINNCKTGEQWIEEALVSCVLNCEYTQFTLSNDEILGDLLHVINHIALPSQKYPIDLLAQALIISNAERGTIISIGNVRESIERFAETRSDIARLSRGRHGQRAEYISIDTRKIGSH